MNNTGQKMMNMGTLDRGLLYFVS